MDIPFLPTAAVFVAAVAIYIIVREKINLRRAATGEDKERLRRAVAQVLPGETGYQVAYGHYEEVEWIARKRITTYFCYALAFDASRIWVIPLRFDKEHILPREPVLITRDNLGCADIRVLNDKKGKLRRLDFTLYSRNGVRVLNCVVEVNNTRDDRFHHVNIIQAEECARFGRLIDSMATQVNRNNAELLDQVHVSESNSHKAYVLAIFSMVFGFLFPPIGLIMSIFGMRCAKKARPGDKVKASLILCRIGLVISIIFTLIIGGALIHVFLG